MPAYVKRRLEFLPVKDMEDVINILFQIAPKKIGKKKQPKKGVCP